MNTSGPIKRECFWQETLLTITPYGLNIEYFFNDSYDDKQVHYWYI